MNFTATWGDHHYLGLTGLEVVGKDGESLPINVNMITANPRDVRSLPGHERDDRTLDKYVYIMQFMTPVNDLFFFIIDYISAFLSW